jgi:hypothetical protein
VHIEVSPVQVDKLPDCGFDFLFAHPAGPTCGEMRLGSSGVSRGKVAIDGQEQFLIRQVRFFRQHISPLGATGDVHRKSFRGKTY